MVTRLRKSKPTNGCSVATAAAAAADDNDDERLDLLYDVIRWCDITSIPRGNDILSGVL